MEPVETVVNSRVRRLAEYLEIDPMVAQELYYESSRIFKSAVDR